MTETDNCLIIIPAFQEKLERNVELDSLYSILQMPKGCPVATMAIGTPGAINAALFATSILALSDERIATDLRYFHKKQTTRVPEVPQDE